MTEASRAFVAQAANRYLGHREYEQSQDEPLRNEEPNRHLPACEDIEHLRLLYGDGLHDVLISATSIHDAES